MLLQDESYALSFLQIKEKHQQADLLMCKSSFRVGCPIVFPLESRERPFHKRQRMIWRK
ncbi:hypothetical protein HMPREF0658_0977 [Hoylesella marshii DSM 16973 = JCM 13450]|uniref:Uncharacterized protein n=1 Tax=Hoylesella marshii DSM 16973 = JCM 13450 TaxID=862515 RepID=E0NS26_9BACT|nr:hypothetical protein HMPREF0658_0977 [Hoylesella marshii DSM 16973 = JCM 13450]